MAMDAFKSLGRFTGTLARTNNPQRSSAMPPPDEIPTTRLHFLIEGTPTLLPIAVQHGMEVGNLMRDLYSMRGAFPSLRNVTLETMELWKVSPPSPPSHGIAQLTPLTGQHRSRLIQEQCGCPQCSQS